MARGGQRVGGGTNDVSYAEAVYGAADEDLLSPHGNRGGVEEEEGAAELEENGGEAKAVGEAAAAAEEFEAAEGSEP